VICLPQTLPAPEASGQDCTSLIVSVPNRPGAVHDLLVPLKTHGVSMTRFESRPARSGQWEYYFYIDLQGHPSQPNVAAALKDLRACARSTRCWEPTRRVSNRVRAPGGRGEPSGVWMFEQLGLIGCGLMGGSFALALKRAGLVKRVVGYSKSPSTTERARQLGVIDVEAPSALLAVAGADIVLLAVPVAATEATLQGHPAPGHAHHADHGRGLHQARRGRRRTARRCASRWAASCRPTRLQARGGRRGTTPTPISTPAAGHPDPDRAHPHGAAAAGHRRLEGHRLPRDQHVARVARRRLCRRQPPAAPAGVCAHERASPASRRARNSCPWPGPGFRDFTRIAASDPKIWRDILLANREELLAQSKPLPARAPGLRADHRQRQRRCDWKNADQPSQQHPRALAHGRRKTSQVNVPPHGPGDPHLAWRNAPAPAPPARRMYTTEFLDIPPALAGAHGTVTCPAPRASPTACCCWPR
jgi:prephenate dehydrogenase